MMGSPSRYRPVARSPRPQAGALPPALGAQIYLPVGAIRSVTARLRPAATDRAALWREREWLIKSYGQLTLVEVEQGRPGSWEGPDAEFPGWDGGTPTR
jgi:hypothetical protein